VRPEEIKKKIREIVGEQIEFEGHFEIVVEHIPENLQFHLISWVKECFERKQEPFPVPLQKNILVFFFKRKWSIAEPKSAKSATADGGIGRYFNCQRAGHRLLKNF